MPKDPDEMTIDDKFNALKKSLKAMDKVLIAYSGGVDSAFLLKSAALSGLNSVLAVTGISESIPDEEINSARDLAQSLNVQYKTIITDELRDRNYADNPPDRCYFCKKELFGKLRRIASEEQFPFILDGTNADDAKDWRPGQRAAREQGVLSPLLEAGLSKKDIRELSRRLELPTWDKPATPCLSSRFPYGVRITADALSRVARAERFLRSLGIKELRVRDHAGTARIEVLPEHFRILTQEDTRKDIIAFFKALGYKQVTLDLQGFRSGSGNEVLSRPD